MKPLVHIIEISGWRVLATEKQIVALKEEYVVMWIVEAPPPAEIDNDGVRGATALDADVVIAPSPSYGLSGSGIVIARRAPAAARRRTDTSNRTSAGPGWQIGGDKRHHLGMAAQFLRHDQRYIDVDAGRRRRRERPP